MPLSILYVDDNRDLAEIAQDLLRRPDTLFHIALSGPEGLSILERHPIDVVISDLLMPDMNGLEFLAQVRDRFPKAYRIIFSGSECRQLFARATGPPPFHLFITKSTDLREFKKQIELALQKAGA